MLLHEVAFYSVTLHKQNSFTKGFSGSYSIKMIIPNPTPNGTPIISSSSPE